VLLCGIFFAACSNSRHLPPGEKLYRGCKVHIDDKVVNKKSRKALLA